MIKTLARALLAATFAPLIPVELCGSAVQTSTLSPETAYAWGANIGWTRWNAEGEGVAVFERFLAGWIWSPNIGWISLGDGAPENGYAYSADSDGDFGINLLPGGPLEGYAWSPNVGWILFEQEHGQPRVNLADGRFSGFAWSANIGWINLGSLPPGQGPLLVAHSMAPNDQDNDGIDDSWERLHFNDLIQANAASDFDKDGYSDRHEAKADTDPRDFKSYFELISFSYADVDRTSLLFEFEWTSSPRRTYNIRTSSDLAPPFDLSPDLRGIPGSFDGTTSQSLSVLQTTKPLFFQVEVAEPFVAAD